MISTLVNLLGGYYESNDFAKVEAIAHSINKAVPGDEISLKFLGLVYYRTGRTKDAMRLFNRVHRRARPRPEKIDGDASAVAALAREASQRVPYLTQAWCELGRTLMAQRADKQASAAPSFQSACLA